MDAPEHSDKLSGLTPKAQAAHWYALLRSEKVTPLLRKDFQHWLDQANEHQTQYESIARLWRSARSVAEHPHILAIRHETAVRLTRRQGRWSDASLKIAVAAAVTAVTVGLSVYFDVPGWMSGKGRYATEIGEQIQVMLPDQSQMSLNTDTRIKTAFSERERRVILKEGQALFNVAKDPIRPFVVEAAGREIYAVGTAFDVRIRRGRVQVTMVEGAVKVPAAGTGSGAMLLKAGDQVTVAQKSPDPAPRAIGEAAVARTVSWRDGQVIFDDAPLSEVIEEMNRYSRQKISLENAELGRHTLSGGFATGKTRNFVETAVAYFPVEVVRWDENGIVLGARQR